MEMPLKEPLLVAGAKSSPSTIGSSPVVAADGDSVTTYMLSTVGCPKETYPGECRVATTPDAVKMLVKQGFRVIVESNAGYAANFPDALYQEAGASVVDSTAVWSADAVLKVRAPSLDETHMIKTGQLLISFVSPAQNPELVQAIAQRKATLFAMDRVPRISRAQVFDALSSMANIAGYKAVMLAAHHFGRFLGGQMTAAGRIPPAKVMIIGGGVAGLSGIATAKNMGAIVRCFDTRPAVREQVQSLGGEFLEVQGVQLEEGTGGYAKEMTKEFIDAEMALFSQQCKEVDIVITTALIPGKPAPRLITKEMVANLKYGSVIVDLAAENGGNCELTKKDELYVTSNGVSIIGYTDLPSRLPQQASRLYANNITKLFLTMTDKSIPNQIRIDLDDDVTRGAIVVQAGHILPPSSKPLGPPPASKPKTVAAVKKVVISPMRATLNSALGVTAGCLALMFVNMFYHGASMLSMIVIFALAGTAGYQAVWGVAHALHTPLMAVTNAISGITAFGGLLMLSKATTPVSWWFAAIAMMVSFVNIFGGFLVTIRMLNMFRRPTDPNEHNYLYLIPGICVPGLYVLSKYWLHDNIEVMTYLAASLCCIGAIGGLASQKTARLGAALGMIGVGTGLVCTLGLVRHDKSFLLMTTILSVLGLLIGVYLGRVVQVTELPQTVAAFHSLVGLAAMLTSVAHFANAGSINAASGMAASILGNLIGGITLTGSIVAFCKLHGLAKSAALVLPGKNALNITTVVVQLYAIWVFMTTSSFHTAMFMQYLTMIISLWLGFHLVASVGGGDMPVCITVLNSYSGWALVAEGFMLNNAMLTVVGSLIGFSGGILSYIMCIAMNRSLTNVLFGGYATVAASKKKEKKEHRETTVDETVELISNSRNIIIVPGYGMAVAKAQHAIAELARVCRARSISLRFAIHPVAGRMPGQMNVLLAEAGVPYDWVFEMEEINDEMKDSDLCLVVGANDTTNSSALEDPDSPIAGMPVVRVWDSKQVIFMKRSMASGYADLENPVFFKENTMMLLGDAKNTVETLVNKLKSYWEP
ncbi:MAG: hypothetical protein KVP17_002249 [Porospora cf. gigantea B]|uniref:uncharacterized protein n=1 Tax=Porospora cf. gigantea B TaxID=2853592 RepID=UPI003571B942|nr:MAG: hypothetical protein KVP17_002249 [Porospora cf. gigantea B]